MSITNSKRGSSHADADVQLVLKDFNVSCNCEEDAVEQTYKAIYGDDPQNCPRCGSQDIHRKRGSRQQKCGGCKYSWSFTTNTYFHGAQKLRPRLMTMTFASRGVMLSSIKLASLAGVAQSTAYCMNKKLALALNSSFPAGTESIASSHLKDTIGKRSFETPARRPPISEQEELAKVQQPQQQTTDHESPHRRAAPDSEEAPTADFEQPLTETVDRPLTNAAVDAVSEVENIGVETEPHGEPVKSKTLVQDEETAEPDIYEYVGDKATNVDRLCLQTGLTVEHVQVSLLMLQLDGKIEQITPGRYVRCTIRPSRTSDSTKQPCGDLTDEQKLAVDLFKSHVNMVWHAVSQKCLQTYLALSWVCRSPERWTFESLLDTCIRFGRATELEVRNYVSPYMVKLPGLG